MNFDNFPDRRLYCYATFMLQCLHLFEILEEKSKKLRSLDLHLCSPVCRD